MPDRFRPKRADESVDDYNRARAQWRVEGYGGTWTDQPPPEGPAGLDPWQMPDINDPSYDMVDEYGEVIGKDWGTYYLDVGRWQSAMKGTGGDGAARGPTAAELAIEQSKVQAANMANYLDAVIRGVEAEISAGRLSLEQAEAEFNRRMDALGEAGTQMAALWQWTVPEDAGALHPDIRANLGMEPWESKPMTWDPYALAQQIIAETPELTGQPVPTDPIQEAIEMAGGLI